MSAYLSGPLPSCLKLTAFQNPATGLPERKLWRDLLAGSFKLIYKEAINCAGPKAPELRRLFLVLVGIGLRPLLLLGDLLWFNLGLRDTVALNGEGCLVHG
jgi:hypothetical protein